jgi:hypothetical protein
MELDERNIKRVIYFINNQTRFKELSINLDPFTFDNVTVHDSVNCCICFEVSRFPIIFSCGHLECCTCFYDDFTKRGRRKDTNYFTWCPICKNILNPFNVYTLSQWLNLYPNSAVSKFYNTLQVRCSNVGCNLFINFSELNEHEMLKCSRRLIRCPANLCPVIARQEILINHTINCPLNLVWCSSCNERLTVIASGHSCAKALQRSRLLGKCVSNGEYFISDNHALKNGDIILPLLKPIIKHDITTLEKLLDAVRHNRALAIINAPQTIRELDEPLTDDFLIDESTQAEAPSPI